jgi:phosphoglycolate phosphatase-like HAD superfamily hydrolase
MVVAAQAQDPLPSWNDGPVKSGLVDFVTRVTKAGGPDFVPPEERIAVFDNDGTLWCEQPFYVQLAFVVDRVKALAGRHPEWQTTEPFKSVLAADLKGALAGGEKAVAELVAATHAGMTMDEFQAIVADWIATAKHPKTGRLYTEMVYQPMLEVLAWLRKNGFKTCIVSGGGQEFMRPWAEKVYGVPPEQVIGSHADLVYEMRDGKPVLVKSKKIVLVDDGPGKPIGIQRFIGRRPIMAFGNSDGDFEMLEWTRAGSGPRYALIVHHDDAEREFAYDRQSHVGRLAKGLDQAEKLGFVVAGMKSAWKVVFPKEPPAKENGK